MSYREKLLALYMKYHGMLMQIYFSFLKLDALNDRREAHLVNLIKSFISGKCHPAMPSLVFPSLTPLSASDDHLY